MVLDVFRSQEPVHRWSTGAPPGAPSLLRLRLRAERLAERLNEEHPDVLAAYGRCLGEDVVGGGKGKPSQQTTCFFSKGYTSGEVFGRLVKKPNKDCRFLGYSFFLLSKQGFWGTHIFDPPQSGRLVLEVLELSGASLFGSKPIFGLLYATGQLCAM